MNSIHENSVPLASLFEKTFMHIRVILDNTPCQVHGGPKLGTQNCPAAQRWHTGSRVSRWATGQNDVGPITSSNVGLAGTSSK